jgi:hypothetical protein
MGRLNPISWPDAPAALQPSRQRPSLGSYISSSEGKKWLDKAQEEGLMTSDQRAMINAIYSIKDAHLHFNPNMKTLGKYPMH